MTTTHLLSEFYADTVESASSGFQAARAKIESMDTTLSPPERAFFNFDFDVLSHTAVPVHGPLGADGVA